MSDRVRDDVLRYSVATLDDGAMAALYADAQLKAELFLRERAITRLATALVQEVKADCPPPAPSTEQQAKALFKTLGLDLTEASQHLFWAADRLKQKGDGPGANKVYEAAKRTKAAAQGLG